MFLLIDSVFLQQSNYINLKASKQCFLSNLFPLKKFKMLDELKYYKKCRPSNVKVVSTEYRVSYE